MYLRHFALTRLPFETPAHTDELFESNARREAEARLQHLIELKGIGLLTGEVGSGKTTVCRHVAAALHPGLYRVGYVSLTTGNVLDMYKSIAWELGLPTERSRATACRTHQRRPPPRPFADGGRGAEPFLITIAVIIATTAAPVYACARCALPRLSGNGGTM